MQDRLRGFPLRPEVVGPGIQGFWDRAKISGAVEGLGSAGGMTWSKARRIEEGILADTDICQRILRVGGQGASGKASSPLGRFGNKIAGCAFCPLSLWWVTFA